MIINNNIPALNTYRQMGINQNETKSAMEKLSSGLRINKAGDDAAGLAISEKMRAQIRGLDQASRNSQDGISMIQTAEGALGETHNILQRMRELATQSANDTNVEVDRNEIQKELNQLSSEINRIGNTTEFNTQKILKGAEESTEIQAAFNLDATGSVTAGSLSGGATNDPVNASLEFGMVAGSGINTEDMTFNFGGEEFTVTFANGAGTSGGNTSGITANSATIAYSSGDTTNAQMADLMKEALDGMIAANNNVTADDFAVSTDSQAVTIEALDGGDFAGGAGSVVLEVSAAGAVSGADTLLTDFGTNTTYDFADGTIAGFSGVGSGGHVEDLLGKGIEIDGKSIEFYNADEGAYDGEADFAVNLSTVINTGSGFDSGVVNAIADQLGSELDSVSLSASGNALNITATEGGEAGNDISYSDGVSREAVTSAEDFEATFQVGANNGQSMGIKITDMRALSLNITGNDPSVAITGLDGEAIEGATYTEVENVTNGTDNANVEYALDVSTHEKATAAIEVINNAIEKVSAERSQLGANQNRLEHTIANLENSAENLQAAESRVRDVDMAREMMEMTKSNILSQASQSMLAQANQQPQSVLQLLG